MEDNWIKISIDESIDIQRGYAFKSSDYVDKGILNFRVTNIENISTST